MIREQVATFFQLVDADVTTWPLALHWAPPHRADQIERPWHELHGTRIPRGRKLAALEAVIAGTIEVNWTSSGKKEPRSYRLRIADPNSGKIEHEHVIDLMAEPVTPEDVFGRALGVGLGALQQAAATIEIPFRRLEEVLDHQGKQIKEYQERLDTRGARIRELEGELQKKTDELRAHLAQYAEAERQRAEAEAIRQEGNAKARAIDRLTDGAVGQLPALGALLLRKLTGSAIPTALLEGNKSGDKEPAPSIGPDAVVKAALQIQNALPAALLGKLRALPITDLEITRILFFLYFVDPSGAQLGLLREETLATMSAFSAEIASFYKDGAR